MSSHPMRTHSKRILLLSLIVSHRDPNTRCRTCHPCNHQQVTADRKRSMRRVVLSGATVGGGGRSGVREGWERWGLRYYTKISAQWESDRWPHAGCHLALPQKSGHLAKSVNLSSLFVLFVKCLFFPVTSISAQSIPILFLSLLNLELANCKWTWLKNLAASKIVEPAVSLMWRSEGGNKYKQ